MTAACPYCGSPLNLGLKFCVVCGRQASPSAKTKMGKLKGGSRHAGMTKPLDDSGRSGLFNHSKREFKFSLWFHYIALNCLYLIIAIMLLYCAGRFALELASQGQIHRLISPLINSAIPAKDNSPSNSKRHSKKKSSTSKPERFRWHPKT